MMTINCKVPPSNSDYTHSAVWSDIYHIRLGTESLKWFLPVFTNFPFVVLKVPYIVDYIEPFINTKIPISKQIRDQESDSRGKSKKRQNAKTGVKNIFKLSEKSKPTKLIQCFRLMNYHTLFLSHLAVYTFV